MLHVVMPWFAMTCRAVRGEFRSADTMNTPVSPMPAAPKNLPRFLPTLTEVVHIPVATPVAGEAAISADDIIDRVMLRLDGPLQGALQAVLGTLVVEKMRELEPRIRDEVDRVVRLAVEDAIAQDFDLPQTPQSPAG